MTFARFLVIGVLNTIVGLGTILILQELLGVSYRIANVAGYAVGLVHSFVWNKLWTFRSPRWSYHEVLRFLVAFFVSFSVQYLVLNVAIEVVHTSALLGQLLAIATYTVVNYGINRYWTFR